VKRLNRFAVWYRSLQSLDAAAWWIILRLVPSTRSHFLAKDAPDVTLWASAVPDAVLVLAAAVSGASQ